ncbi:MAG TPA: VOC family protein [Steroidobacteraceae bacterium]|nr:VOC family protein [Steroidobacteraceae bacterium]
MNRILGIDHIAITVSDLEAACRFYDRLFAAQTHVNYAPQGKPLVRQIALGGALLSVHQAGNGIELAARNPAIGSADICFRWEGGIASAVALLHERGIEIIEGPVPRRTAGGLPSKSVYFRDLDANLIELMATE